MSVDNEMQYITCIIYSSLYDMCLLSEKMFTEKKNKLHNYRYKTRFIKLVEIIFEFLQLYWIVHVMQYMRVILHEIFYVIFKHADKQDDKNDKYLLLYEKKNSTKQYFQQYIIYTFTIL